MHRDKALRVAGYVTISVALAMTVTALVLGHVWKRKCVDGCSTDADCGAGQRCVAGQCVASDPSELFANVSSAVPPDGGLLAHMSASEDFEAALKSNPFSYGLTSQGVADCAAYNRKTCSAWTYLRRDLPPMVFIAPSAPSSPAGYWTPLCGVIIDPRIAWPLVASMSVVDSDTNLRSCCGNESGATTLLASSDDGSPSIAQCVPPRVKDWVLYLSSSAVGSCPKSCAVDDLNCRAVNAGGGVNTWDLINWPKPCDCLGPAQQPSPADLAVLEKAAGHSLKGYSFYTLTTCPLCSGPYACSTTPLAEGADYAVTAAGARAYVGPSGSGFADLFYSQTWDNFSLGDLAVRQCKFLRDTWSQWLVALKDFYAKANSSLEASNEMPGALSYLQSNPCSTSYLENEVNVYVDPSKPQDGVFRDAIVGFYWVSTTCAEQLAPLAKATTRADDDPACTFNGATDRCQTFLCGKPEDCPEIAQQKQRIAAARDASRRMAAQFNATYRQGKPQVACYSATPGSNTFFNKDLLTRAAKGEIAFSEVFQPDPGA
jgi:hypothetical protein